MLLFFFYKNSYTLHIVSISMSITDKKLLKTIFGNIVDLNI